MKELGRAEEFMLRNLPLNHRRLVLYWLMENFDSELSIKELGERLHEEIHEVKYRPTGPQLTDAHYELADYLVELGAPDAAEKWLAARGDFPKFPN